MNGDPALLADRHFRPDPQGVLAPKGEGKCGRVLVSISEKIAVTMAGQHLVWMLVNQLARQVDVVGEITLNVPETLLLEDAAAFGVCATLRETLETCVRLVAGENVDVNLKLAAADWFDVHIVIGVNNIHEQAEYTWYTYADGWCWYVGNGEHAPIDFPKSNLSIGPYLAASTVAGEVFKSLRKMRDGKGELITECFGSAWTMSQCNDWGGLVDGPKNDEIPVLSHFYFAGAGAVAQAAGLTLGSSRIKGAATAIDHDNLDITNGNRYILSIMDDQEESKVGLLSDYLTSKSFPCHPAPVKLNTYVSSFGKMAANDKIASLEQQYRFSLVLSCVDKNLPRHEIQNLLPGLIIGGSTDGLVAKITVYFMGHDSACLKCFNPIEDRNANIRLNKEKLADMTVDQRKEWCVEKGIAVSTLKHFLELPECGKLSEADLDAFAEGSPDMSVGFVSVTAGVMLAAQLIRTAMLGVDEVTVNGHTVNVTFSRTGVRHQKCGPEAGCDCRNGQHDRWCSLWDD